MGKKKSNRAVGPSPDMNAGEAPTETDALLAGIDAKATAAPSSTPVATPAEVPATPVAEATAAPAATAAERLEESPRKLLRLSVFDVCVPGLDTPGDPADPLYDIERVTLPLDEALVVAIIERGIDKPGEVVLREGRFDVAGGQRRVRHAREASKRTGKPVAFDFLVIDEDKKLSAGELFLSARKSNALAVTDGPLAMARNSQRAVDVFGLKLPEIAKAEGVDLSTLKQHRVLLKLLPELQAKVETGELSGLAGSQLGKFKPEDQLAQYTGAVASGNLNAAFLRRQKGVVGTDAVAAEAPPTATEGAGFDHSPNTPAEEAAKQTGGTAGAQKKEKVKVKAPGYTMAEVRKVRDHLKDLAKPTATESAALHLMRIITGEVKPASMVGMKAAFDSLTALVKAAK